MYTGTSESNQGGGYTPKTGIASFNLLGVNPTAEQIKQWTGRDSAMDPNYDLTQNLNGQTVRPVHFWVHSSDADVTTRFIINIGADPEIAKSGNFQVCTSTGGVVWAKKDGIIKEEFANHKPLTIGEADLILFIQKLINFKSSSGEDFYGQMVKLGQDAASLYKGDYKGLNNLAKWTTENNKSIVMVLTVQKKDVTQADGSVVSKEYQSICANPRTWFHGTEVTDWIKEAVKANYEASLVVGPGQTQAYPIIKHLFTYALQLFKEEDCVNYVPANPTGGWN